MFFLSVQAAEAVLGKHKLSYFTDLILVALYLYSERTYLPKVRMVKERRGRIGRREGREERRRGGEGLPSRGAECELLPSMVALFVDPVAADAHLVWYGTRDE